MDPKMERLEYPDMNVEQADYVYALIWQKVADDPDPNIQNAQIPLKDALTDFNIKNEFKASFAYLYGDRVRLSLEKMPRDTQDEAKQPETNEALLNVSKYCKEPKESVKSQVEVDLTKTQKKTPRKSNTVKHLEPSFIRTALQMILDFITEPTEASLVFRNSNMEQCFFLQSILAMANAKRYHGVFSDESKKILREIAVHINTSRNYIIKIVMGTKDRNSKLRTVSLIKTPKEGFQPATSPSSTPSTSNINTQASKNVAQNTQTTDKPERATPKKSSTTNIIDKTEMKEGTKATTKRSIDTGTGSGIKNQLKTIDDKKTIDKRTTEPTRKYTKSTIIRNPEHVRTYRRVDNQGSSLRNSRLVEGLSTPLESDVAMRMMRQMGWEGGPLGARGDGLAEPVMPDIHLKSGAGLGHTVPKREPKPLPQKPAPPLPRRHAHHLPQRPTQLPLQTPAQTQPQQPKPPIPSKTIHCHKPADFRLDILRHIFKLITEEPLERIVIYSTKLVKKELKFLENTTKTILRRDTLTFKDYDMQDIFRRISEKMAAAPNLQIRYTMGGDRKSLLLCKQNIPKEHQTVPNQPVESVSSIASKYILAELITPKLITMLGKQLTPKQTDKAARSLGHRIVIIATILDLIKSKDTERVISFDYPVTCKQVTYIKDMVSSINGRKKWTYSTSFENHLAKEMLAAMEDKVYVFALFGCTNQHITLHKIFGQPRKLDILRLTNNNNIKVASKETTKPDESVANAGIDVYKSDKDVTDTESTNKESLKKSDVKDEGSSAEPMESKFEKNTKGAVQVILDDREEVNITGNVDNNKSDDTITDREDDQLAGYSSDACSERSHSDDSYEILKDNIIEYMSIVPEKYPYEKVGIDEIITCQNKIWKNLEVTKARTLIECIGIKNGAIIYCCYSDFSVFFIDCVARQMNLKTINVTSQYKKQNLYKMKARLNSYVDINLTKLFAKVEHCNTGLKTDSWSVKDMQAGIDHVIISMEMDKESFDYVTKNHFCIFAGVDKLKFNVAWD